MALRDILLHPDSRLEKPCAPIETFDASLRGLADDMLETMYHAPGIGLAAPQIGVLLRLIVMDCSAAEEDPAPLIMVNPEITWQSEEMKSHNEGCLSIPDQFEEIERPAKVTVKYFDLDGQPQSQTLDGLWATCVQHEIDHLNGKLFIDYLSRIKRGMITRKMQKFKKDLRRPETVG